MRSTAQSAEYGFHNADADRSQGLSLHQVAEIKNPKPSFDNLGRRCDLPAAFASALDDSASPEPHKDCTKIHYLMQELMPWVLSRLRRN